MSKDAEDPSGRNSQGIKYPQLTQEEVTAQAATIPEPPVVKKVDPYLLFKSIDQMRKEGFEEEVIQEAFAEYIREHTGTFRKLQKTMRRTPDMAPMPTQEEINKIYEERYGNLKKEDLPEEIQMILDELENGAKRSKELKAKKPRLTLKVLMYRIVYFSLNKFLGLIVWVFAKMGVK